MRSGRCFATPCAAFSGEHWSAIAASKQAAAPEEIAAIWTRLVGQGVAALGCDFSEGGLARNSGGDGRTWPRGLPGADVVGRSRQSRRFRDAAQIAQPICLKNCMREPRASRFASASSIRIAMPARSEVVNGTAPAACFALSKSPQVVPTFSWRSKGDTLAVIELGGFRRRARADPGHGRVGAL